MFDNLSLPVALAQKLVVGKSQKNAARLYYVLRLQKDGAFKHKFRLEDATPRLKGFGFSPRMVRSLVSELKQMGWLRSDKIGNYFFASISGIARANTTSCSCTSIKISLDNCKTFLDWNSHVAACCVIWVARRMRWLNKTSQHKRSEKDFRIRTTGAIVEADLTHIIARSAGQPNQDGFYGFGRVHVSIDLMMLLLNVSHGTAQRMRKDAMASGLVMNEQSFKQIVSQSIVKHEQFVAESAGDPEFMERLVYRAGCTCIQLPNIISWDLSLGNRKRLRNAGMVQYHQAKGR